MPGLTAPRSRSLCNAGVWRKGRFRAQKGRLAGAPVLLPGPGPRGVLAGEPCRPAMEPGRSGTGRSRGSGRVWASRCGRVPAPRERRGFGRSRRPGSLLCAHVGHAADGFGPLPGTSSSLAF